MEAEDRWKVSSLPRHVSRDSHFVLSKSGISEVFESLGTANRTNCIDLLIERGLVEVVHHFSAGHVSMAHFASASPLEQHERSK